MPPTRDNENDDGIGHEEPDWRTTLANVRARMREELGDTPVDIDEIIREMREDRGIQLLSAI